jgi:hypothetical protein
MKSEGMHGDIKSQISYDKWKEEEIKRIRACWDELSINPALRETKRRIINVG